MPNQCSADVIYFTNLMYSKRDLCMADQNEFLAIMHAAKIICRY